MRKYAIKLLVFGSIGVGFALLLVVLTKFNLNTTLITAFCVTGIVASFSVSLYAVSQLAKHGHLTTSISKLLKM